MHINEFCVRSRQRDAHGYMKLVRGGWRRSRGGGRRCEGCSTWLEMTTKPTSAGCSGGNSSTESCYLHTCNTQAERMLPPPPLLPLPQLLASASPCPLPCSNCWHYVPLSIAIQCQALATAPATIELLASCDVDCAADCAADVATSTATATATWQVKIALEMGFTAHSLARKLEIFNFRFLFAALS